MPCWRGMAWHPAGVWLLMLCYFYIWPGLEQNSSWFSIWVWLDSYGPTHCTTSFVAFKRWNDQTTLLLLIQKIYIFSYEIITWKKLSGEKDPRCPMEGLDVTILTTQKAFEDAQCLNHFKVLTFDFWLFDQCFLLFLNRVDCLYW